MFTLKHDNVLALKGISFSYGPLTLLTPWMDNSNVRTYLTSIVRDSKDYNPALYNLSNKWVRLVCSLQRVTLKLTKHTDPKYRRRNALPPPRRDRSWGSSWGTCIDQPNRVMILIETDKVNIFVNREDTAVIADFGLSLFAHGHSGNYHSRRAGNQLWTAPELFHPQTGERLRPTLRADIFSFAMVCIEVRMRVVNAHWSAELTCYSFTPRRIRIRQSTRIAPIDRIIREKSRLIKAT